MPSAREGCSGPVAGLIGTATAGGDARGVLGVSQPGVSSDQRVGDGDAGQCEGGVVEPVCRARAGEETNSGGFTGAAADHDRSGDPAEHPDARVDFGTALQVGHAPGCAVRGRPDRPSCRCLSYGLVSQRHADMRPGHMSRMSFSYYSGLRDQGIRHPLHRRPVACRAGVPRVVGPGNGRLASPDRARADWKGDRR